MKLRNKSAAAISLALALTFGGCSKDISNNGGVPPHPQGAAANTGNGQTAQSNPSEPTWHGQNPVTINPDDGERVITLLGTNDIHGGIEAVTSGVAPAPQKTSGGSAQLAGTLAAIRRGLQAKYGERSGTLTVDAGDQFQGQLISNYDEGQLTIATLTKVGYDAAVPGNHDYDFGPIGWLNDQIIPGTTSNDPREAFKRVVSQAGFPYVGANTYYKASLRTFDGQAIPAEMTSGTGCAQNNADGTTSPRGDIMWADAQRPEFLVPYIIKHVGGLRIAMIGIDRVDTNIITTPANVTDLCFRDEVASYNEVRDELEGQADVFVMVIHNGSPMTDDIVKAISSRGANRLHAVIAGHTHRVESSFPNQVPVMQSGSGGDAFGRITLVWSDKTRSIVPEKTRVAAGVRLLTTSCSAIASQFCQPVSDDAGAAIGVAYDGVTVVPSDDVKAMIATARIAIAPLASKQLFTANAPLKRDRILESPLANLLTDTMRAASGADLAFTNTGGIRTDLAAGPVTYENFYAVQPFNNHALLLGPLKSTDLIALLTRSIQTCGDYGALMQSGLIVKFKKDCSGSIRGGHVDPDGFLTHVEVAATHEVLLDLDMGVVPNDARTFTVATLDFLAAGGDGFGGFSKAPLIRDLGIFRELLVNTVFATTPVPAYDATIDNRFVWIPRLPVPAPSPSASATP